MFSNTRLAFAFVLVVVFFGTVAFFGAVAMVAANPANPDVWIPDKCEFPVENPGHGWFCLERDYEAEVWTVRLFNPEWMYEFDVLSGTQRYPDSSSQPDQLDFADEVDVIAVGFDRLHGEESYYSVVELYDTGGGQATEIISGSLTGIYKDQVVTLSDDRKQIISTLVSSTITGTQILTSTVLLNLEEEGLGGSWDLILSVKEDDGWLWAIEAAHVGVRQEAIWAIPLETGEKVKTVINPRDFVEWGFEEILDLDHPRAILAGYSDEAPWIAKLLQPDGTISLTEIHGLEVEGKEFLMSEGMIRLDEDKIAWTDWFGNFLFTGNLGNGEVTLTRAITLEIASIINIDVFNRERVLYTRFWGGDFPPCVFEKDRKGPHIIEIDLQDESLQVISGHPGPRHFTSWAEIREQSEDEVIVRVGIQLSESTVGDQVNLVALTNLEVIEGWTVEHDGWTGPYAYVGWYLPTDDGRHQFWSYGHVPSGTAWADLRLDPGDGGVVEVWTGCVLCPFLPWTPNPWGDYTPHRIEIQVPAPETTPTPTPTDTPTPTSTPTDTPTPTPTNTPTVPPVDVDDVNSWCVEESNEILIQVVVVNYSMTITVHVEVTVLGVTQTWILKPQWGREFSFFTGKEELPPGFVQVELTSPEIPGWVEIRALPYEAISCRHKIYLPVLM